MKPTAFFSFVLKQIPIQPDRAIRLLVELRKAGLFPDGRDKTAIVTPTDAAHAIRILAIAPNPLNPLTCNQVLTEYSELISSDGRNFIEDLSEALFHGGIVASKPGIQNVRRILISLDRPVAVMEFEDAELREPDADEKNIHLVDEITPPTTFRSEVWYGREKFTGCERWAIIDKGTLREFSHALQVLEFYKAD